MGGATLFSHVTELDGTNARYRAVLIDVDGCTVATVRIKASNDDEAVVQAAVLVDGHGVDLWDGVRLIEHFPPVDPPK
jgi:hypothetical protein